MDAFNIRLEEEIQSAMKAILLDADPEDGPRCPHCGESTLTGVWRYSHEIRISARGNQSSASMDLAMYRLMGQGMFDEAPDHKLMLSAKGRQAVANLR